MKPPRIPVVVTQYGKFDLTKRCIADLRAQAGVEMEIWLVDVASPGMTPQIQEELTALVDYYMDLSENIGFAAANNFALKDILDSSQSDSIAILNNDTEFGPETFATLHRFLQDHPKAGQVGPRLLYPDGSLQGAGGYTHGKLFEPAMHGNGHENIGYAEKQIVDFVSGCTILMNRAALEKTGFMSEDYFMYSEDVDWSLRFHKAGFEVWYCPDVVVVHHESVGSGRFSSFKGYYLTRSHILLAKTWLKPADYKAYLKAMRKKLIRQTVKYGAHLAYVQAMWRGFRDGKRRTTGPVA